MNTNQNKQAERLSIQHGEDRIVINANDIHYIRKQQERYICYLLNGHTLEHIKIGEKEIQNLISLGFIFLNQELIIAAHQIKAIRKDGNNCVITTSQQSKIVLKINYEEVKKHIKPI